MRFQFVLFGWLAPLAAPAFAAGGSALDALKLLPKDQRKLVARIEARDGSPVPGRWHILVSAPQAENGLREFVVADGAIVADRTVSQFAESISPDQVIGDTMRFDSDRAAQIAQQFAQVNGLTVATISYQLRKDGTVPLWRLTCYDEGGKEIGALTIMATKGAVISHDGGFVVEPPEPVREKPRERLSTSSGSQVTRERPVVERTPPRRGPEPPKPPGLFERLFGPRRP